MDLSESEDVDSKARAWGWLFRQVAYNKLMLPDGSVCYARDFVVRAFALCGTFAGFFELLRRVHDTVQAGNCVDECGDVVRTLLLAFHNVYSACTCSRGCKLVAQACASDIAAVCASIFASCSSRWLKDDRPATRLQLKVLHVLLIAQACTVSAVLLQGPWSQVAALLEHGLVEELLNSALTERAFCAQDDAVRLPFDNIAAMDAYAGHMTCACVFELLALRVYERLATDPLCPVAAGALRQLQEAPIVPRVVEGLAFRKLWERMSPHALLLTLRSFEWGGTYLGLERLAAQPQLLSEALKLAATSEQQCSLLPGRGRSAGYITKLKLRLEDLQKGVQPAAAAPHPTIAFVQEELSVRRKAWMDENAIACDQCLKALSSSESGSRALACSGCRLAVYCGRSCQRAAWHAHKRLCASAPSCYRQ